MLNKPWVGECVGRDTSLPGQGRPQCVRSERRGADGTVIAKSRRQKQARGVREKLPSAAGAKTAGEWWA